MHLFQYLVLRFTLFGIGLFVLAACQKSEVRYSMTLDREALMGVPFPAWRASGDNQVQRVDLSDFARKVSGATSSEVRAQITPIYVVKLDASHAVMLTETLPTPEGNQPWSCHACSGIIGAYFFEHSASGWSLSAQQNAVAESGVNGNIGETKITKLADGHFALTAEWGSCWQGNCGSWLVLVGLQANKATLLHDGIALSADNDGAYGACSDLDKPTSITEAPDLHECQDIRSHWKFHGKRLLINFEGRLSKLAPDGKLLLTQKIAQQTIYDITTSQLTLTEGVNPVPSF
jgi:hypothetical protein